MQFVWLGFVSCCSSVQAVCCLLNSNKGTLRSIQGLADTPQTRLNHSVDCFFACLLNFVQASHDGIKHDIGSTFSLLKVQPFSNGRLKLLFKVETMQNRHYVMLAGKLVQRVLAVIAEEEQPKER